MHRKCQKSTPIPEATFGPKDSSNRIHAEETLVIKTAKSQLMFLAL